MASICLVEIVDITKHKWEIIGPFQECDIVPQENICAHGHSCICASQKIRNANETDGGVS